MDHFSFVVAIAVRGVVADDVVQNAFVVVLFVVVARIIIIADQSVFRNEAVTPAVTVVAEVATVRLSHYGGVPGGTFHVIRTVLAVHLEVRVVLLASEALLLQIRLDPEILAFFLLLLLLLLLQILHLVILIAQKILVVECAALFQQFLFRAVLRAVNRTFWRHYPLDLSLQFDDAHSVACTFISARLRIRVFTAFIVHLKQLLCQEIVVLDTALLHQTCFAVFGFVRCRVIVVVVVPPTSLVLRVEWTHHRVAVAVVIVLNDLQYFLLLIVFHLFLVVDLQVLDHRQIVLRL